MIKLTEVLKQPLAESGVVRGILMSGIGDETAHLHDNTLIQGACHDGIQLWLWWLMYILWHEMLYHEIYLDAFVQNCSNSIANTLE